MEAMQKWNKLPAYATSECFLSEMENDSVPLWLYYGKIFWDKVYMS